MQFSVKIEGLDRLAAKSQIVAKIAKEETAKALYASALKVEADAKKSILNGQKTGRVYKRRSATHRASAPGEAPANDTGRLVNSVSSYLDTTSLTSFVVAGRGAVKYAAMLEFGTARMAARPFLFPALEMNKPWIASRLEKALGRTIDRATKQGVDGP